MYKNIQKEYINISNEYRSSYGSNESVGKLYDLLYYLEKIERTKSEDRILSNIYTLLGYHQSAYELFRPTADLKNKKEIKKLYVLEDKAKSHSNTFAVKDIRKLRKKNRQPKLSPDHFFKSKKDENIYITEENIVIFNKIIETEKFQIEIYGNHKYENFAKEIIEYIHWLENCKIELIEFYNSNMSQYTRDIADEDWFDTLEIIKVNIIIGKNGKLFTEITSGDNFMSDHLLDVEIEGKKISSMNYDG